MGHLKLNCIHLQRQTRYCSFTDNYDLLEPIVSDYWAKIIEYKRFSLFSGKFLSVQAVKREWHFVSARQENNETLSILLRNWEIRTQLARASGGDSGHSSALPGRYFSAQFIADRRSRFQRANKVIMMYSKVYKKSSKFRKSIINLIQFNRVQHFTLKVENIDIDKLSELNLEQLH